jgi:hypothetical protein
MRNGLIGLTSALVFASTMAATGCSDSSGGQTPASGGSSNGSGGSSGGSGGQDSGGADSSSGGSAAVDGGTVTGIGASAALNALTTVQASQLCSDARAYFARSISKANACKFAALSFASSSSAPTDADLRAGCSSTENTCNGADASSMGTMNTCLPLPATCTATVAQYSECIVEETAFFNQSVPPLASCSTVTRADFNAVFDVTTGINQGASCAALTAACPDLVFASPI